MTKVGAGSVGGGSVSFGNCQTNTTDTHTESQCTSSIVTQEPQFQVVDQNLGSSEHATDQQDDQGRFDPSHRGSWRDPTREMDGVRVEVPSYGTGNREGCGTTKLKSPDRPSTMGSSVEHSHEKEGRPGILRSGQVGHCHDWQRNQGAAPKESYGPHLRYQRGGGEPGGLRKTCSTILRKT